MRIEGGDIAHRGRAADEPERPIELRLLDERAHDACDRPLPAGQAVVRQCQELLEIVAQLVRVHWFVPLAKQSCEEQAPRGKGKGGSDPQARVCCRARRSQLALRHAWADTKGAGRRENMLEGCAGPCYHGRAAGEDTHHRSGLAAEEARRRRGWWWQPRRGTAALAPVPTRPPGRPPRPARPRRLRAARGRYLRRQRAGRSRRQRLERMASRRCAGGERRARVRQLW